MSPSTDILIFRWTFHVWQKRKPSQDIFNIQQVNLRTIKDFQNVQRDVISLPDILLNFPLPDKMSGFVRREFTPLLDIWKFRRTCPVRPVDFAYSEYRYCNYLNNRWQLNISRFVEQGRYLLPDDANLTNTLSVSGTTFWTNTCWSSFSP